MTLIDNDLFNPKNKVQIAIERLREFQVPDGYYLAFSGGKDSIVVYDLAVKAGVKFDAHYNNTTVDPPELIWFIRENYPDVEEHHPKESMWKLIPRKLMPPTRKARYCCAILKEKYGNDRVVVTGIRKLESSARAKREMFETCRYGGNKFYLNPIIDWTENDVWEYIGRYDLEVCSLYNEGYKRLGCIMCPGGGVPGRKRDMKRYPKYYQAYMRAFDRMLRIREERGLKTTWKTAQDVMDWWIK